jgi:hypothetical protein
MFKLKIFIKTDELNEHFVYLSALVCAAGKALSGTLGTTSNFLLHLKRSHSNLLGEYERHKQTEINAREAKRKATATGARISAGLQARHQSSLNWTA